MMGTLCYTQVNNSINTYEGNTLLVYGNPGFLHGDGLLNTTVTWPQRHPSSNQLQTRIDYRGGTVGPGQPARMTAVFQANNPGMKGVYWWNDSPPPNGAFVPDPYATKCTAHYLLTSGNSQIDFGVTNESEAALTGTLQTFFFNSPDATDMALAEKLLSGGMQGFLPTNQDVIHKVGGAGMQGTQLSLPSGSALKVRGAPKAALKAGNSVRAATVMKITGRDGEPFDGFKYVVIGDNDLDC